MANKYQKFSTFIVSAMNVFMLCFSSVYANETTLQALNPVTDDRAISCVAKKYLMCYKNNDNQPLWVNTKVNDARGLILKDGYLFLTQDNHADIFNANNGHLHYSFTDTGTLFDPVISSNYLILTNHNGQITVLDIINKSVVWQYPFKDGWLYPPSVHNNTLFTGGKSGFVWAIDLSDGHVIWRKNLGQELVYQPVLSNNSLIISTFDGRIHSLHLKNGHHNWQTSLSTPITRIKNNSSDEIIASAYDGKLYALKASTGQILWQSKAHSNARFHYATTTEHTASIDYKGHLKIFNNHSGKLVKEINIEGHHQASPLIMPSSIWIFPDEKPVIKLKININHLI